MINKILLHLAIIIFSIVTALAVVGVLGYVIETSVMPHVDAYIHQKVFPKN